MAKITERTYNSITTRFNKYIAKNFPELAGDEIGWYTDIDSLETKGTYSIRGYNPDNNKSYLLVCNWDEKTIRHEIFSGDFWNKYK